MLESYISGALVHFHDIILLHQQHRYWHYGITLPSDNPNSLAAHLKLNNDEYTVFMTGIGLLRIVEYGGKRTLHVLNRDQQAKFENRAKQSLVSQLAKQA